MILKVQAEKLCIEMDDIGKGIVELAYQHGIKKLVMGAAADKRYSEYNPHLLFFSEGLVSICRLTICYLSAIA